MSDVERMRAEFFRRTRKLVLALYLGSALVAAALVAVALADDAVDGALGFLAAFALAVLLFWVSPMIPTSAKAARALLVVAPLSGIVAAQMFDLGDLASDAAILGACGGGAAGMAVGIAAIRRRLAHDDELFLRQKRLGFDPEKPSGWLRG